MRTLQRNKRSLKYSLLVCADSEKITDSEGNLLETGENDSVYTAPQDFKANIVQNGNGYSEWLEYGLNSSEYNAVIVVPSNSLPIKEGSLIWEDTEPRVDSHGYAMESSADYKVVKVSRTINVDKFLLRRLVNTK